MTHSYTIPKVATRDTLIALHNELLATNAGVRVLNRWGAWTEYSVKLKKRDAELLLGASIPGRSPWRVVAGLDEEGLTIDLQHYDDEDAEWHSVFEYGRPGDEEAVVERVKAWLREHEPAIEALVEIDGRMLNEWADLRQLHEHARKLQEDSGVSRAELARRIGVSEQLVGRALNYGELGDARTMLAIVRDLAGEEWDPETRYRRW